MRTNSPVYVVDDEASVRASLCALLSASGFHVQAFASGDDFLERLDQLRPGVMILDLRMPGTDGLRVLEQRPPEFATIVYSATVDEIARDRAVALGAFDVLEKPCPAGELLERVAQAARGIVSRPNTAAVDVSHRATTMPSGGAGTSSPEATLQ